MNNILTSRKIICTENSTPNDIFKRQPVFSSIIRTKHHMFLQAHIYLVIVFITSLFLNFHQILITLKVFTTDHNALLKMIHSLTETFRNIPYQDVLYVFQRGTFSTVVKHFPFISV